MAPDGIVSTGWPRVRETCRRLGWLFDGWQDGSGRLILAKRSDGDYAADTIVMSIPRQVGKTYLVACIIYALCLLSPGLKVIWTAHRKSTAAETFRQFDGMSQRPKVAPHIRQVLRGKGDESILFNNGSRIEFGARESGFGRGRTDVDVIVFDEGQILPESTLEDMGAAQNVAVNPLTFVMGTPPRPKDDGEFFTALREEALDGESDGTLYVEMSADPDAEPMDRDQWRKANPSFPHRTSERAMLRLRKKLKSDESWRREALGIWDDNPAHRPVFTSAAWTALVEAGPDDDVAPTALAVDMSPDRVLVVAGCWRDDAAASHVELLAVDQVADPLASVEWIASRAGRRIPIVIDGASPAASLVPALKQRGCSVIQTGPTDMAKACGLIYDLVMSGRLSHAGQQQLDDSMAGARKRPIRDAGGWGWDRKDASVNIAPTVAVTLAVLGAMLARRRRGRGRTGRNSTSGRKAAVLL